MDVIYIYTGELGRQLAEKKSLAGKWVAGMLKRGEFFPNWVALFLWFDVIKDQLVNKNQVVIFDGTPRRLAEMEVVDTLMADFERPQPIIINIEINEKESKRRLSRRGRNDDVNAAIRARLRNFNKDVAPIIEKYKKRVLTIDGNGPKPDVWERLKKAL